MSMKRNFFKVPDDLWIANGSRTQFFLNHGIASTDN